MAQKAKKSTEVKEPVFEKPKLKKSQRVQREIQKEELEIVELKKHELEKLALQEMVKYLFACFELLDDTSMKKYI